MTEHFEAKLAEALGPRYALLGAGRERGATLEFSARDRRRDALVALHVLRPETPEELNARVYLSQLEPARRLRHPRIRAVLDTGVAGGLPYFTQPAAEAESLRARVERVGPLEIPLAIVLVRDIVDALACAHRNGLAHLELSAECVLLTASGALVSGFGVASARALALAAGEDGGSTPDCEAAQSQDMWSLGALVYEALTSQRPARGTEPPEPVNRLRHHLPAGWAHFVMRCLAPDPARRPTVSAGQVLMWHMAAQSSQGVLHLRRQARFLLRRRGMSVALALERYERALELEPDHPEALAGLAEALSLLVAYEQLPSGQALPRAAAAAEAAAGNAPELADGHCALAFVEFARRGPEGAARAQLERALELDPTHLEARVGLALLESALANDHEHAVGEGRRVAADHPSSALAARALGLGLVRAGRTEEGLASLRHAADLVDEWPFQLSLAWGYERAGRGFDAHATLSAARESCPDVHWLERGLNTVDVLALAW